MKRALRWCIDICNIDDFDTVEVPHFKVHGPLAQLPSDAGNIITESKLQGVVFICGGVGEGPAVVRNYWISLL